jgi:hypothetical protein
MEKKQFRFYTTSWSTLMSRLTDITILAGLQFFHCGIGVLFTLAILLIKPFRDQMITTPMQMQFQTQATPMPTELIWASIIGGVVGAFLVTLVELLLGYGLLKRKGWAWICTLILHILLVLGNFAGFFVIRAVPGIGLFQQIFQIIFQIILSGAIVYYLFRQDVKQAFGR